MAVARSLFEAAVWLESHVLASVDLCVQGGCLIGVDINITFRIIFGFGLQSDAGAHNSLRLSLFKAMPFWAMGIRIFGHLDKSWGE